jgi:hypothetical protein
LPCASKMSSLPMTMTLMTVLFSSCAKCAMFTVRSI